MLARSHSERAREADDKSPALGERDIDEPEHAVGGVDRQAPERARGDEFRRVIEREKEVGRPGADRQGDDERAGIGAMRPERSTRA
jgi:hypothetical protein